VAGPRTSSSSQSSAGDIDPRRVGKITTSTVKKTGGTKTSPEGALPTPDAADLPSPIARCPRADNVQGSYANRRTPPLSLPSLQDLGKEHEYRKH